MVLVARVVMGVGMGMARTLCPSYIQDVVHPRNSWLETCLPPTMAAAGILLGQVGYVLVLVLVLLGSFSLSQSYC